MKKSVQSTKKSIYFRYEFSDETGCPEGGDIFHFPTQAKLQKFMTEVLNVAKSDGVIVNFTIGEGELFIKFLKNLGLSQKEIDKEMVDADHKSAPTEQKKTTKKKLSQKKARTSSKLK